MADVAHQWGSDLGFGASWAPADRAVLSAQLSVNKECFGAFLPIFLTTYGSQPTGLD